MFDNNQIILKELSMEIFVPVYVQIQIEEMDDGEVDYSLMVIEEILLVKND
jgi:hypothetical protein